MSIKLKAINGIKWTALSSIFSVIISLARIAILTRILDRSVFGIIAIVMFLLGISRLVMDMGISVAILHKQNITDNQYSSLYCFNLLLGIFIFILMAISAPLVAIFYQEPELAVVVPLMAITILFAVAGLQHKVIERKELNFKFIEKIEISSVIIAFIIAILLAYNDYGVYALVYSSLVQYIFANTIYIVRGLWTRKYTLRLKGVDLKPFLKIGGFQTAGQFLNYFSAQLDTLLIGKLLGMETLGGYNLAKALASRPIAIINPIVNKVAAPILAQMQKDEKRMESSFLRLLKILSLINFPIYFGAVVLAQPFIELLYGTNYSDYSEVFRWLCLYMLLRSLGNPIGSLLVAKGRTDLGFYWNVIVLLTMPLIIFITAQLNINAVALGLFLLMFVYLFISYFMMVRKLLNISLMNYIGQFGYAFAFSSIMSILMTIIYFIFSFSVIGLVLSVFFGVIIYTLLLYFFGLRIDEELFKKIYDSEILRKVKIKPLKRRRN